MNVLSTTSYIYVLTLLLLLCVCLCIELKKNIIKLYYRENFEIFFHLIFPRMLSSYGPSKFIIFRHPAFPQYSKRAHFTPCQARHISIHPFKRVYVSSIDTKTEILFMQNKISKSTNRTNTPLYTLLALTITLLFDNYEYIPAVRSSICYYIPFNAGRRKKERSKFLKIVAKYFCMFKNIFQFHIILLKLCASFFSFSLLSVAQAGPPGNIV